MTAPVSGPPCRPRRTSRRRVGQIRLHPRQVVVKRKPARAGVREESVVLLIVHVEGELESRRPRQRHAGVRHERVSRSGSKGHETDGAARHRQCCARRSRLRSGAVSIRIVARIQRFRQTGSDPSISSSLRTSSASTADRSCSGDTPSHQQMASVSRFGTKGRTCSTSPLYRSVCSKRSSGLSRNVALATRRSPANCWPDSSTTSRLAASSDDSWSSIPPPGTSQAPRHTS